MNGINNSGIARSAFSSSPDRQVMKRFDFFTGRWTHLKDDIALVKKCFEIMWHFVRTDQEKVSLANEQLNLIRQMDRDPDLKTACFDIACCAPTINQTLFPIFMSFYRYACASNPGGLLFNRSDDDARVLATVAEQSNAYRDVGWEGRIRSGQPIVCKELAVDYKCFPYRSMTYGPPLNLNGAGKFLTSQRPIKCGDIFIQFIKDVWENEHGKVNWSRYSSPEAIVEHVSEDNKKYFYQICKNVPHYDIIHTENFGKQLSIFFQRMLEEKTTLRTIIVMATEHGMAIKLSIKQASDCPIFVANLHDANITPDTVRCASNDLSTFEKHTLKDYLGKELYDTYFLNVPPFCLLMDCNPSHFITPIDSMGEEPKGNIPDSITSSHLYFLLTHGYSKQISSLLGELQTVKGQSIDELCEVMTANNAVGTPGLSNAMEQGDAATVKEYAKLLLLLFQDELHNIRYFNKLMSIMACKNTLGTPGMYLAFERGHAHVIEEFSELLYSLQELLSQANKNDDAKLLSLIAAEEENGLNGLYIALQMGHANNILALADSLKKGNFVNNSNLRDVLINLLLAKFFHQSKGESIPGVIMALAQGHAEAIRAYGTLLEILNEKDRQLIANALLSYNEYAKNAAAQAFNYGHTDVIDAYSELQNKLINWLK